MANTIKHKRSSTPSATPSTSDLELGELAVNTYDGKLFLKKDDGTASVVEIGAGGGGGGSSTLSGLTDVTITSASTGEFLKYDGSGWVNSSVIAAKNYIVTSSNSFNTSLTPSSGALSIDSSLGNILLGALSASVTDWNFTNVTTDSNRATNLTVIIDGNSSYTYGGNCSVNGSAVSGGVIWFDGSAPTATDDTDVISFTIIKDGSGTFKVFGAAAGSSTLSVSQLSDTTITSASSGEVLQYDGSDWVNASAPTPTGSVIAFAGASAPSGWLLCDGTAVSRSTYADLFTIISTTYGSGDGSSTFNVPDLRRRAPYGKGTSDSLGDSDGVAEGSRSLSHTHSVPAHYHGLGTLATVSDGSHTHTINHDHGAFTSGGSGTLTTSSDSHNHTFSGTTGSTSTNQFPGKANSSAGNTSKAMRASGSGSNNNTFDTYFNHSHSFSGTTTTDTHNHTISSHTHSIDVPSFSGSSGSDGAHTHSLSGSVGATGSGIDGDSEMTSGSATLPHLIMNYIIKT